MDTPKLRDPEWQAAIDRAIPHLRRFQEHLNDISEDLRAVERTLTESGFRIGISIDIGSGNQIAWSEAAKSVWRILHVSRDDRDDLELRPLIEMPAAVRWHAAKSVPQLLAQIASVADSAPVKPQLLTDDDIPF